MAGESGHATTLKAKCKSILRKESDELPAVGLENGESFPTWKRIPSYGHPIHGMMARLGSFPPALARYFILGYSRPGDLVIDPFCGKGTTLVEALIAGRASIGSDVAPDAVAVARAKVSGVRMGDVTRCLAQMARELSDDCSKTGIMEEVVPEDVRLFYHSRTLEELLRVRSWLLVRGRRSRSAQFLLGCLLGILHGKSSVCLSLPSAHAYAMAPGYVKK